MRIKWGRVWDSNPRSPVPQTGALTSYAKSTIFYFIIRLLYKKTFLGTLLFMTSKITFLKNIIILLQVR